MAVDDAQRETPDEREPVQPADPFEPEAPAHLDPDAETAAHRDSSDSDGIIVDEDDPAPDPPLD